jgi:two-component system sensor histidine kinase AlgZ
MARRGSAIELSSGRLPRELLALYLVAPLVTTPVLSGDFFRLAPAGMVRELAANCVAFLTIPPALHLVYRRVMPRLLARCASFGQRLAVHVAMAGAVTACVALSIYPIIDRLFDHGPSAVTWTLRAVAVALVMLLPALVFEELRGRATAAERRLLEQRQAALRAQLEALQSRTHPHFLFNAINAVVSLIQEDPVLAERTLERLADVLRYALQSARRERVPLGDELAMAEDYLEIQRARFGERLRYTIDLEPGIKAEVERLELPPLVLQPLIENAVVHGIAAHARPGQLRLTVRRRGAQLEVRVDDDGPGLGGSTHAGSGTGLRDLAHRLELVYGGAASLAVGPGALGGVTAELILPAAP